MINFHLVRIILFEKSHKHTPLHRSSGWHLVKRITSTSIKHYHVFYGSLFFEYSPSFLSVTISFYVWSQEYLQIHFVTMPTVQILIGSGQYLTDLWMLCGWKTWTQFSTTTRSCAWWAARSFPWIQNKIWSLKSRIWSRHRRPLWAGKLEDVDWHFSLYKKRIFHV